MTVHRFFIESSMLVEEDRVVLTGEQGRHARVVRLRPGETFEVVASGFLYSAVVDAVFPSGVRGKIVRKSQLPPPEHETHLFVGILKGAKMDLVVEKTTELGVHSITPVVCERSVPLVAEPQMGRKVERWRKIAVAASEQSKRTYVPEVRYPVPFHELADAARKGFRPHPRAELLIAWEGVRGTPSDLPGMIAGKERVGILVGPEGGFSDSEVEEAEAAGFKPVSLGSRLLAAETACIAAVGFVTFILESTRNQGGFHVSKD